MKFIAKILKTLFAIYGIIVFIIMLTSNLPFEFLALTIFGKRARKPVLWFKYHVFTRVFLTLMLIFVRSHGKKNIDKNKSYVFVSNHTSQLDIMANPMSSPIVFKFLSKIEMLKVPLMGYLTKNLALLVDRKDKESRGRSFENMKRAIESGDSPFLYPEGTRNRTKEKLTPFYDGAFRLAVQHQTPIAVMTVVNANNLSNPHTLLNLRPGIIDCYIDKPIEVKGMTEDDIPLLKEKVAKLMLSHL